MSEFTLSSAVQAWRFRKWYFILPALMIPLAAVLLCRIQLPPVYESKSTILIEEQQIPQEFVRSTVTGYADQHVQVLTQQILSRTKFWEIVEQFNLYAKERQKDTKEAILEQMRKDIKFETISAEVQDKKEGPGRRSQSVSPLPSASPTGGKIRARCKRSPARLSSLYLEQNLKIREEQAQTTTRFLEAELSELKRENRFPGKKISAFKEKNPGSLPELAQFNQAQAVSLENELRRLDGEIQVGSKSEDLPGRVPGHVPGQQAGGLRKRRQQRSPGPAVRRQRGIEKPAGQIFRGSSGHPAAAQGKNPVGSNF